MFASGLAINAFVLFWTRFATGVAKANSIPVHQSLIADNYPIGIRARMSAAMNMGAHGIGLASPVLVAAIATWAGGPEGWRWAWYLLGIPVVITAFFAFFMKEPPRGQFEKDDVLHELIEDADPAPISMEAAFARIKKIATIRTVLVAFCALGFGLFSQGELASLYLHDHLHVTNVLHRGLLLSLSGIAALPILPFVGQYFDRAYRKNPAKALAMVGALILPSAIFTPLQYSIHSTTWFWILGIPQAVLTTSAFAMTGPVLQAVVPYRLRGMGTAMATMYIFFIGGFGGGIISGFFTNAIGVQGTVIALGVPTSIIGGLLLMNGARFIRNDLSLVVEELLEEQDEHRKRADLAVETPVLQVANIDFSYGTVQVLFDVNFEINRGECVALLGTNGAGKSTILRVISGLEVPERGVVRLNGRNVTYVAPESRVKLGVLLLPGGKGVFPDLTVEQNLELSAHLISKNKGDIATHVDEMMELFPELAQRRKQLARSLSGGQQQMLALAHPDPPARGAHDRRALARAGSARRRTLPQARRRPQGARPDDAHRRAVAQRRALDRRSRHLPREGFGAVRRVGPGSARTGRPRARRLLRYRGRIVIATVFTANLLFIGLINGLSVALIAMGIVLVYRSSRVINFAVGDLGVPAAALLAVMVGQHHIPYWPGADRRAARRHVVGHGDRAGRDPPAVQGAPRDRARRDDRCRRARARSPTHSPTTAPVSSRRSTRRRCRATGRSAA